MISLPNCNGFERLRAPPLPLEAYILKNWLHRWFLEPLLALLRQGISPQRLALCVAIAVVVGNIPILGVSTILCAFIALIFRLNLPAIQLVQDRKSTRLNSSHQIISYAVFCLKKKRMSVHVNDCTGQI